MYKLIHIRPFALAIRTFRKWWGRHTCFLKCHVWLLLPYWLSLDFSQTLQEQMSAWIGMGISTVLRRWLLFGRHITLVHPTWIKHPTFPVIIVEFFQVKYLKFNRFTLNSGKIQVVVFFYNRKWKTGAPKDFFCKISVRRNKCWLEFSITWGQLKISRWSFHSCTYNLRSLCNKFRTSF